MADATQQNDSIAESFNQEEDLAWVSELEDALSEGCEFGALRAICNGRKIPDQYRPQAWKICLNVRSKGDALNSFDNVFDLPQQEVLRQDCRSFIDKFDNSEEEKLCLASDLESVLTFYCKSRSLQYVSDRGWLALTGPFLLLKLERPDLYNCFYSVLNKYIPKDCGSKSGMPFNLFRLLLMYHEPELCNFLESKRVTADLYVADLLKTLFASSCDWNVVQLMWDIYFLSADPFLAFFLALVILVNAKEMVLELEGKSRAEVVDCIKNFPPQLEVDDVEDFCSLAQYYASKTPQSFRRDYQSLFGGSLVSSSSSGGGSGASQASFSQTAAFALCLPVSVSELAQPQAGEGALHYFVVDCRPAEQYNAGHLKTAFHLDANLLLQQPTQFSQAVRALEAMRAGSVAGGGEHLCLMGSGREEEDQYVHMVVANFLQRKTPYVSMAQGGYAALHRLLEKDLAGSLVGHDPKLCLVCNPSAAANHDEEQSEDMVANSHGQDGREQSLLNKFKTTLKTKSASVKEKLTDFIKNEGQAEERHVSSLDVGKGKPYRGQEVKSVFSIGGDDEVGGDGSSSEDERETVALETWLKRPEVKHSFKCSQVKETGYMTPSYLAVSTTHLYILRVIASKPSHAHIYARRPLDTIVKITSKKRHPELITFRYGPGGSQGAGGPSPADALDRFLIPSAGEATKVIKQQIMRVLDALDS